MKDTGIQMLAQGDRADQTKLVLLLAGVLVSKYEYNNTNVYVFEKWLGLETHTPAFQKLEIYILPTLNMLARG